MTEDKMTRALGARKTEPTPHDDANERSKRRKRSRVPIVTAASHVSQRTVESVFGIDERRYLELLREHADHLTVTNVGKLRVVSCDDLRDLLAALASDLAAVEAVDDESDEADEGVLARLGLQSTRRTA